MATEINAALVKDLKQRGMLEDTLVIWGGEFGRTVYSQGGIGAYGRDHHPRCFSVFFAGGGVKGEYFRTVSDGVRAHLQHLMIYAGMRVDDPVADRTRKVQSWGILDRWRSRYGRQITFSDVGSKWAPADRGYAADNRGPARDGTAPPQLDQVTQEPDDECRKQDADGNDKRD